jgi:N-acetyl sugar amidotransferase
MDNVNDPEIIFNQVGICNHCDTYDSVVKANILNPSERDKKLDLFLKSIKEKKNGKYDCIIGLSGGTDSSYVAYLTKQLGLSPLAVHFDNGWNSELSVRNIEKILNKLDIDLYTYVVDWQEFRDLQRSYIKASVVDIEAITDHAITAILHKVAREFNIKFIMPGSSIVTEGILPSNWIHNKADVANIKDIHQKHGEVNLKTFPFLGIPAKWFYKKFLDIHSFRILDYVDYNKVLAQEILKKELNWVDYGGKHYESLFTKFYQGYILPQKFNIDKRRSHLSTLICAGQMSRTEALRELDSPPYDNKELALEKKFVLKKLGFSTDEFNEIMKSPRKSHLDYKSIMHVLNKGSLYKQKFLRFYKK